MTHIHAKNLGLTIPVLGASRSFRSALVGARVGGKIGSGVGPLSVEALRNINLSLDSGDRLGLIGHNGAGKSTLLRVLAGRYMPSEGTLDVQGRMMPLLSLGAGMDGDFSGYENILFYGLFLGLTREEARARSEDIANFTELGDFLHLPIRTYSSGMLLRLSFAVATSVIPEILLVDELFGAGDSAFYAKAKKRMEDMLEKSNILVMATHSTELIKQYCNKAIVMERGQIAFMGDTDTAAEHYKEMVARG